MPEHAVKRQELLIRRLPVGAASLLRLHEAHVGSNAANLHRHLTGTPSNTARVRGPRAFALGESEWLLIDYPRENLRRSLRLLGRALVQLTDVSRSRVSFAVEGPASRSVLGMDEDGIWTGAARSSGEYARTRLGDVAVVAQCTGRESFELHTDRDPFEGLEHWIRHRYMTRLLPPHPGWQ